MAAATALLFDLDGTLVDSAPGIAAALSALRRERGGGAVGADEVRPLVSLGAPVLVRRALAPFATTEPDDLAAFRAILSGLPPDRSMLYPGATEALAALQARGHPMAIVTNKPEGLSRALVAGLELAGFFGAVVGGDSAAAPKPARAPLDLALTVIGRTGRPALLIGDSAVDAGAARAAGIPFVLFEGGYGADECDDDMVAARFDRFEALPAIVARLGGMTTAPCATDAIC